jgi:RNA polymerase sigma-70 factor (ECF subfamily)
VTRQGAAQQSSTYSKAYRLETLPESLRMTVYYADVHGYLYREIAEILDIPIGTVMSRLHSARRRLRALLVDVAHDHGLV